jgi:biopolymer transport protein ExbD
MNLAERKRRFRHTGYWSGLELSGLGGIVFCGVLLVFFLLMLLVTTPRSFHNDFSVDYVRAPHAIRMARALREDAIVVAVMRDGVLYLRSERLMSASELPNRISEMLHSGSERTVYIKADNRTLYGNVTDVIDAVHESGLERIVFLTEADK